MRRAWYEKSEPWRRAMDLVERVYRVTQGFPAEEKSGLAAGLRRGVTTLPGKAAAVLCAADEPAADKALAALDGALRDLVITLLVCQRLRLVGAWRVGRLRARCDRLSRVTARSSERLLPAGDAPPPLPLPRAA